VSARGLSLQGLKPNSIASISGTTEVVPFPKIQRPFLKI